MNNTTIDIDNLVDREDLNISIYRVDLTIYLINILQNLLKY